jgi:hypothetical protein
VPIVNQRAGRAGIISRYLSKQEGLGGGEGTSYIVFVKRKSKKKINPLKTTDFK